MMDRLLLARRAARAAMTLRLQSKIHRAAPICVYDLAGKLGLEVRFCGGGSFGGMYSKETKTILVPSLRPPGRQAYTAAHELGHWYFQHGSKIDDLDERRKNYDSKEWLADQFAAHLLMPKGSLEESFGSRSISPETCGLEEIYLIACEHGVGYETLVKQLHDSYALISNGRSKTLLRESPKAIRKHLVEDSTSPHLVYCDLHWRAATIDLQVSHILLLPPDCTVTEGGLANPMSSMYGTHWEAKRPGIYQAIHVESGWSRFIRISPASFEGRAIYRHLEDPDVD